METQKTQFLNEIDRLSREYFYADHMNAILGVYTDLDEVTNLQCDYLETLEKCEHLEKELSKSRTMSKSFEALQKHAINLELDLQHAKKRKNDKTFKGKSVKRISERTFLKVKVSYHTKCVSLIFKPVTAQFMPQHELPIYQKHKCDCTMNLESAHKPNQTRTPRCLQENRKTTKPLSFPTGVIPTTRVIKPHLMSNQLDDRVLSNNSQGKKQDVEDHRKNFKSSKSKTSVTVCNNSLNARTSNVNFVCVTCGKCMLNDNHDLCVLHYINGVSSRTRQPIAVPISTREPKHNVNQSVATS
ncbi:hypothetical protein Tco_0819876 [Tanacetum coccineum]|uniref:Uncharacterized protein n=1 Tax=Tanacetum coccineum TaxID=301880 RepID=A0ABQ5AAV0_9ASTR